MSQLADHIRKSAGILAAAEAISNRRAFITLFATFTVTALIVGLFGYLGTSLAMNGHGGLSATLGFLGALLAFVLVMTGTNATGFVLNDTMRGHEQRTISGALLAALAVLPRVIGVLLMVLAIGIVVLIAVALVLVVCKIPGLGPLLYAFVFPLAVVLLGVAFYAGLFVVALHGPAIWEGNTAMRTLAILGTIVRQRLMAVVIQSILLALFATLVSTVIFGALGVGVAMTTSLSLPILGQGGGEGLMANLAGMAMGMGGGGGGYAAAAAFGGVLLLGSAVVAPCLVIISGNCIIYANVTDGLSAEDMENSLKGAFDTARAKAEQARRQLEESRQQLAARASAQPPSGPAPGAATCPNCHSPVTAGDAFCGNCGQRLG